MSPSKYTDLVLDLGGVLFTYSVKDNTTLRPRLIQQVLCSSHWFEYERGRLSQQQCYDYITEEFGLSNGQWDKTMSGLKSTLKPNQHMIGHIKELKTSFPGLRVHGLCNISAADFQAVKPLTEEWDILDSVTASASIGCRKPDFESYRKFLDAAQTEAQTCIFVDDQPENVIAAHSLGFHGILFTDTISVITKIHNLLGDPVARGLDFLRRNAKNLFCETDNGVSVRDNFSQLLILQCIGDRDMITLENSGDFWQFFIGERLFTDDYFPEDFDTTALALVTLPEATDVQKKTAIEEILKFRTPDGLPLVYCDPMRPRLCPNACANILRLFYLNGQGYRLGATLRYLCRILSTEAYQFETRYYCQPDWLFYYLADLCSRCSHTDLNELRVLLAARLRQRMGCDRDVVSAAMRMLAAQALKLENNEDLRTLLSTQQLDGGWGLVWIWKYGQVSVKLGNRGVSTALALKAIMNACSARLR